MMERKARYEVPGSGYFVTTSVSGCNYYGVSMPLSDDQPIYGVGYAVISSQKGDSAEARRLMAARLRN